MDDGSAGDASDLFDIYGSDADLVRARANAMARRAQGLQGAGLMVRALAGDRDPTGGAFLQMGNQQENQLAGAAQHQAQMGIERQRYANEAAWRAAMLGISQQKADTAGALAGLKASEVGSTSDAFGNPLTYLKHGQGGPLTSGANQSASTGRGVGASNQGPLLGPMTQQAIDQAAEQYATTGQMPQLGRGKGAAQVVSRIANRAAELHPDANLAGNKAGFTADMGSLKKLQQQADATNAFEGTALANLNQFIQTAKGAIDTGSPLFNAPAREFMNKVAGDPQLASLGTARQTAVQEISKVLSGSMGNAGVSDSARKEAADLLGPNASLAQIVAASNILKADMANRHQSFDAQIQAIRNRAGGRPSGTPTAVQVAPASAPAQAAVSLTPQDQAAIQWAKDHPADPRAAKIMALHGATQ